MLHKDWQKSKEGQVFMARLWIGSIFNREYRKEDRNLKLLMKMISMGLKCWKSTDTGEWLCPCKHSH